jgi:transmembrane sensor
MTTEDRGSESALLEHEAHRWITQLISGEATVADAAALERWCGQSPAHAAAFADATRRWNDFGPIGRDLLAEGRIPPWFAERRRIGRRAVLGGAGALAATAAGYAIISPPLGLWPSLSELTADHRTSTGEQRRITLAENVSVRLNTQTSIAVTSSADDGEQVKLIAGEASFTTSLQSEKPLIVVAGNGRSVASRARFDVRNLESIVCVTCLEGELRVGHGMQAATVRAKQQVRYDASRLTEVVGIDPTEVSAWQDGILIFRFTPLSQVVAELNRYRPGKIILINASLGANPVNGRFRIQRIDEVLVWIEEAFGAKSRSLPGGIILLS